MRKVVGMLECVSALLLLWFVLSWVEVITKNIAPNPNYSPINMFTLLF